MTLSVKKKTIDQKIDDLAISVAKGFDEVNKNIGDLKKDTVDIKTRLGAVEMKLDFALYRQLDKHEHWIKEIAEKVGVRLK